LLSKYWSGPRSAYAEIRKTESSSWEFDTDVTPDAYADLAIGWITDYEVQIIGGCCGTRPDHIRALKQQVAEHYDAA
jgi:5-methyltetrahydrofolate--homocysteine methyltransferase